MAAKRKRQNKNSHSYEAYNPYQEEPTEWFNGGSTLNIKNRLNNLNSIKSSNICDLRDLLPNKLLNTAVVSKKKRKRVNGSKSNISEASRKECAEGDPLLIRAKGVFPGGVKPSKVIVMLDNDIPNFNFNSIKENKFTIIEGRGITPSDFIDRILNNEVNSATDSMPFTKDSTLFVVQPWFSFFLDNLKGLCIQTDSENKNLVEFDSLSIKNPLSKQQMGQLLKICYEFSSGIEEADLHILTATGNYQCGDGVTDILLLDNITLLTRRLLYSALQLRATVLANTVNTEVVMSPFPIMCKTKEMANLMSKVPPASINHIHHALVAALHVFNVFAANSWRLGGFHCTNISVFSRLGPIIASDDDDAMDYGDTIKEELALKRKKAVEWNYEDNNDDLAIAEENIVCFDLENSESNSSTIKEEMKLDRNTDCGKTDDATIISIENVEKCAAENVSNKKKVSANVINISIDSTCNHDMDKNSPNSNIQTASQSVKKTVIVSNISDPNISLSKLTAKEAICQDKLTTGLFSATNKKIIKTDTGLDALIHNVVNALSEDGEKEPKKKKLLDTSNSLKMEQQKVTVSSAEDVYMLCDLKLNSVFPSTSDNTTNDIGTYVQSMHIALADSSKNSVALCEMIALQKTDTLPDIITESVERGIISPVQDNKQVAIESKKEVQYQCSVCPTTELDALKMAAHCYNLTHIEAVRVKLAGKLSVLTGTIEPNNFWPISADFKARLIVSDIIHQEKKWSKSDRSICALYCCLLCSNDVKSLLEDWQLPFHLASTQHKTRMCTQMGVPEMVPLVPHLDNWDQYQSELRHAPLDVVLVADDVHSQHLSHLALHTKVRVMTFPKLLISEESWKKAVAARNSGVTNDALYIILAGADMLDIASMYSADDGVDKAVQCLENVSMHIRGKLPSTDRVLTAPLLPLSLLTDEASSSLSELIKLRMQTIRVREDTLDQLRNTYNRLAVKTFALHCMSAFKENIYAIHERAVSEVVSVVPAVESPAYLPLTPWHVAMEGLLMTAVHGMPTAKHTSPDNLNLKKVESVAPQKNVNVQKNVVLHKQELNPQMIQFELPKINLNPKKMKSESLQKGSKPQMKGIDIPTKIVIVINANLEPVGKNESRELTIIRRKTKFTEEDYGLCTAAVVSSPRICTAWYFSCSIAELLFKPLVCNVCKDVKCDDEISFWTVNLVNSENCSRQSTKTENCSSNNSDTKEAAVVTQVDRVLSKITNFLSVFQSKLPSCYLCTVFPSEPLNIIHCDDLGSISHKEMHALQDHYPNVIFSNDSLNGVLIPAVHHFNKGLESIFKSRKMVNTLDKCVDSLSRAKVFSIGSFQSDYEASIDDRTRDWLTAANSILRRECSHLQVRQPTKAITVAAAWLTNWGTEGVHSDSDEAMDSDSDEFMECISNL